MAPSMSRCADHQAFAGCFYHLTGNSLQTIELDEASDLGNQTIEQAKVARRDPDDGGNGFLIGELQVHLFLT